MDEYTLCFRLIHSYDHLNQAGGWLPPLMRTGWNGFHSADITSSELPPPFCSQRSARTTVSILRHHLVQLHQGSIDENRASVVALLTG